MNTSSFFDFCDADVLDAIRYQYSLNDRAHQFDHVIPVAEHADKIIRAFPEDLEHFRHEIMMGVLLHDSKCHVDRDTHHLLGAAYVSELRDSGRIALFSEASWELIRLSVLEHRSSWKHKRFSVVSQAVAAADAPIITPEAMVKRSVLFRVGRDRHWTPTEAEDICEAALRHMHEKFGYDGYAWENLPNFTKVLYAEDIEQIKTTFSSIIPARTLLAYAIQNFNAWVNP